MLDGQAIKGEIVAEPIYAAGEFSSTFTLVLDGNVDVSAGDGIIHKMASQRSHSNV
jgi:hypothetical protein